MPSLGDELNPVSTQSQYVLLDMSTHGRTTGVDRYLEQLTSYLKAGSQPFLRVSLVECMPHIGMHLVRDGAGLWVKIPLPRNIREVLGAKRWTERYNEEVLHLLTPYLDLTRPTILHIHTLNLIDLAYSLKQRLRRGIILSHLHCIPWKGYVNSNKEQFNRLYALYTSGWDCPRSTFLTGGYESRVLSLSDHIVTVTSSGSEYLERMSPGCSHSLIPNGLDPDTMQRDYALKGGLRLLFVGTLTAGKGLDYVLQALQLLQRTLTLPMLLAVAGEKSPVLEQRIQSRYPELDVKLYGNLPQAQLSELYQSADIGIIASVQEQCSYAALEMMRAGLPIVTTAVDGLDELFVDEQHALKVPLCFDRIRGLSPDISIMADRIRRLAGDEELRRTLGSAAYQRYQECYTLQQMGERTLSLYRSLLNRTIYTHNPHAYHLGTPALL